MTTATPPRRKSQTRTKISRRMMTKLRTRQKKHPTREIDPEQTDPGSIKPMMRNPSQTKNLPRLPTHLNAQTSDGIPNQQCPAQMTKPRPREHLVKNQKSRALQMTGTKSDRKKLRKRMNDTHPLVNIQNASQQSRRSSIVGLHPIETANIRVKLTDIISNKGDQSMLVHSRWTA